MANIIISGTTYTIFSDAKLDDLKKVAAYRPRALQLFDADENGKKVPVFMVGVTDPGKGCIGEFGAAFGDTAFDGTDRSCISKTIPAGTADAKAYVQKTVGMAIAMLDKVEAQIAPALAEIAADEAAVAEHITIA